MLGEVTIGHMFIFGRRCTESAGSEVGLLGADYKSKMDASALRESSTEKLESDLARRLTQPEWTLRPATICSK